MSLDNVKCQKSRYVAFITGYHDMKNITDISLLNCEWNNVKENNKIVGLVGNLEFINTKINGELVK